MSTRTPQSMLAAAGIPPSSFKVTLTSLGQPLLRSIVQDGSFMSSSGPVSYLLETPSSEPSGYYGQVLSRFAAELCMTGRVEPNLFCYVTASLLDAELSRYARGANTEDSLLPKVYDKSTVYFVVPDLQALASPDLVVGFLLNHISYGGGVITSSSTTTPGIQTLANCCTVIPVSPRR